jgi:uncharacterized protein YnzC (UPF0291/DUF896 family)
MFRSTHPKTLAKKEKARRRKQRKQALKNFRRSVRQISKILTTK